MQHENEQKKKFLSLSFESFVYYNAAFIKRL